jgi:hypothetical protein
VPPGIMWQIAVDFGYGPLGQKDRGYAGFREFDSLLKNSLGARVQPTLGTKYAGFEAFRARFVVAISSIPPFSTGWGLLGTSVNKDRALAADHRLALRRLRDAPPLRVK